MLIIVVKVPDDFDTGSIDGLNITVEDLLEVLEKADDSRRPEQVN